MKTLIIGLNWLGDIIMSLPAINAAMSLGEIHIITRPHLADIYRLFSNKLVIHPVETGKSIFSVWPELGSLRQINFDHCIIFPDSLRSAAVARAANSAPSTGYSGQWRSALLSNPLVKPADFKSMHESDLYFNLVKSVYRNAVKCELPQIKFDENCFNQIFSRNNIPVPHKYYLMAPGAAFGSAKRWPPLKFAELADLLYKDSGLPVIITGSSGEKEIAAEIISSSKSTFIDFTGKTSIVELSMLLHNSEALIANDSGTMHLSTLTGTPTVVPVGPTDMRRTGPLNTNFKAVISDTCNLIPCRKRICPRNDHACMLAISPQELFSAIKELKGKSR